MRAFTDFKVTIDGDVKENLVTEKTLYISGQYQAGLEDSVNETEGRSEQSLEGSNTYIFKVD